jgi:signal transduction histidine kinase
MSPQPTNRSRQSCPLCELVQEVCRPLQARLNEQSVQLLVDIPAEHVIVGDPELLRRAVWNLVLNALDAMPHGGTLTATSAVGPSSIELEIADTGPALSEQQRREAFDLSTGWGLAVVRHVAKVHGGSVTAANCPDGGVAMTLRIPRPAALEAAA